MKQTVEQRILRRIRAKRNAWVFTPKDLMDLGSRHAIDQALRRLIQQEHVRRLDRGIYYYSSQSNTQHEPIIHPDAIARAIAAQTGDRVMLTGEEAALRLGLISAERTRGTVYHYLTTGHSKERTVGDYTLRFRRTSLSPPNNVTDLPISVMQALLHLGRDRITVEVIEACARYLQPSEREQLIKLTPHAPAWLVPILHSIGAIRVKEERTQPSSSQDHEARVL